MMNDPNNVNSMQSTRDIMAQSKKGLREFFQDRRIKNLVGVLVPGALAAAIFPVFGPAVAGVAAVFAIKNGLNMLGISFSDDTIKKLVKPLEGQQLDESDMQDLLQETLKKLLPTDKQANEEAAKGLVTVAPDIKDAALANPKLDVGWLAESLETNLQQQGEMMAIVAPRVRDLIQLDPAELLQARNHLLANWSIISQEVFATGSSEVSDIEQVIGDRGGQSSQTVAADDHSIIRGVKQRVGDTSAMQREDDPDHGKIR